MISLRTFALILSGAVALVGLLLLATPVTAGHGEQAARCGDGFKGMGGEVRVGGELYGASYEVLLDCEDAIGTRRAVGWPLLGVGVVVALGAAVVRTGQRAERA